MVCDGQAMSSLVIRSQNAAAAFFWARTSVDHSSVDSVGNDYTWPSSADENFIPARLTAKN